MPFNPEEILNTFQNLDSIPQEAKDKLTALRSSLKWVAPELIQERVFYDFKSQQGLTSILQQHVPNNKEVIKIYSNIIQNLNN